MRHFNKIKIIYFGRLIVINLTFWFTRCNFIEKTCGNYFKSKTKKHYLGVKNVFFRF